MRRQADWMLVPFRRAGDGTGLRDRGSKSFSPSYIFFYDRFVWVKWKVSYLRSAPFRLFARAVRKRALPLVQIERKVGHYLDSKGHHFKWTLNGKHGGKPCIHVVERLSLNFALIVKLESWRRHTKKIISQHISPQSQKSRHREREKSQMDRWGLISVAFFVCLFFLVWNVCFYGFRVCRPSMDI
jgi:hypothetical protein